MNLDIEHPESRLAEREKIRLIYREVGECVSLRFLRLVDISTF